MHKRNHPHLFVFIALLLFLHAVGGLAQGPDARIVYPKKTLDYYTDAQYFELHHDDLVLKGVEVGPKDGVPLVLAGGYSSNFPYLRKLVRELADQGFRVFSYNPPGQGAGDLVSESKDTAYWNSFAGLVHAFEMMVAMAHQKSGGQKVVISGHSLGGMQARAVTLGVEANKLALVVPLFSPPIVLDHMEAPTIAQKLNWMVAQALLVKSLPTSLGAISGIKKRVPRFLHRAYEMHLAAWMVAGDYNPLLRALLGGPDLDIAEVVAVGGLATSERIPDEISRDLGLSIEQRKLVMGSTDIGRAWVERQSSGLAVPSLYFVGSSDFLALMRDLRPEIEMVKGDARLVQGGHMGPLWDKKLVPIIVEQIIQKLQNPNAYTGCLSLLK